MKRLVLTIVIGLIFTFKSEAKKLEGQIFYKNDTFNVTLNIPVNFLSQEPNYEKIQFKVKYFDSSGEKKVLRPDDAIEFRFNYRGEEIRMVSRNNTLGLGSILSMKPNVFLRLAIDGDLKLFYYYYTKSSPGMYNASTGMTSGAYTYDVERFVLQKGDGELRRIKGLTFKKDLVDYFRDCPDLSNKIERKEFRKSDVKAIVLYYNKNCN